MASLLPFAFDWTHLLPFEPRTPAPRPGEIRDTWRARNGTTITLRATREDDAGLLQELVRGLSLRSRYHRFFYAVHELPPETLHRFTHNEPHEAMNLIALVPCHGREVPVAMAQYVANDYPVQAEFAVVVADEWQREGLGRRLVETLACIARAAGIESIRGDILAENVSMQRMMLKMGFELEMHPEDAGLYRAVKTLSAPERKCSPLVKLGRNPAAAMTGIQA